MLKTTPVVFISYAHEGDLHERVKALAAWLTDKGVQVITDHPYTNRPPEKGWRAWMQHNIEDADIVLMVCSDRYKKLFEKREVPDDGGRGVTWESAIITDDLYDAKMHNQRLFPILPDGGSHQDIPSVLRDWNNGHTFPSGNDGILSLIRDEVVIPTPAITFQHKVPGELSGSDDPRLVPISGEVIGRTDELEAVRDFLDSTAASISVCGHVTGSGGIGKTEVCKAAIKQWLADYPDQRVFYVTVSDTADTQVLLVELAKAVGLSIEDQGQIQSIEQLRPHLKSGLYYLDNLEHVAESAGGVALLRNLAQLPGMRWLASSRVVLDHALGNSITVGRLDKDSAYTLFMRLWNGEALSCKDNVSAFVDKELGGHPLSISLLARLGKSYSWKVLQERWQQQGTALAKTRKATERLDSLEISFALTRELLSKEPGALPLWQFAALFPEGFRENTLEQWENLSGYPEARQALIEHHIIQLDQGWVSLLPPISRYALARVNQKSEDATDFDWQATQEVAYQYFIEAAQAGSEIVSSDKATLSRVRIAEEMWAIARLVALEVLTCSDEYPRLRKLHHLLNNAYMFNSIAGRDVLRNTKKILQDGLSSKRIGDLEMGLGQIGEARTHYDEAIQLYQQEQAKIGLANAFQALGDLESRLGQIDEARAHYDEAIQLYQQEQAKLGLANALQALGDLESRLGQIDEARAHYDEAIQLYQQEQAKLGLANALKALGDLESRLGQIDEARAHYDEAIQLYQQEQAKLGLANALKALGNLESRLGQIDEARAHYDEAIQLYQQEQTKLGIANVLKCQGNLLLSTSDYEGALRTYDEAVNIYRSEQENMGLAYTLADVIRCNYHLDQIESMQALAIDALTAAQASGTPQVEQYVLRALYEVCGEDEDKLKAFLGTLEG